MSATTAPVRLPVQSYNTTQRILDNQLDQILALIKAKDKSLEAITKAYPKLTQVILDCALGKNKEITGNQLKAVQMALSNLDGLEKSIKESEEVVRALQTLSEQQESNEKTEQPQTSSHFLPKL
ncbi:TPA: hypothetical protein ACGU4W_001107 [Vibrio vulnificus]|nr:hypothetical protein [Vibrio vulnificus]